MRYLLALLILIATNSINGQEAGVEVTATVYHAIAEQCNSEYWRTASNKEIDTINPIKHRWIAISRDLEDSYCLKFGDKVCVDGAGEYDGIWTVEDRMNRRWIRRIDLLVGETIKHGKWQIQLSTPN